MAGMTLPFLDLSRHGRRLDVVPAGHGLEFLAVSVVPGAGGPIGEDEAAMLRDRGFRRIADDAYANLRSVSAEAGLILPYRGSRRVDYDPAKHERETFPGSSATPGQVMHVAWGLVDEEMAARARRFHDRMGELMAKGDTEACRALARAHLEDLRTLLAGIESMQERMAPPEEPSLGPAV